MATFARPPAAIGALAKAGANLSALEHDRVVRQLVTAGTPLDHVINLHWTAVIEAIVLGDGGPRHQATLRALLEAGARTHLTDREGRTPLQLARARGYTEMVRLLERTRHAVNEETVSSADLPA